MSNELFNQMLSAYDLATHQQKRNATFEVNQQIILAGLYNGGFFNEAAIIEAPAYASSMACSDSPRTWTSRYLLQAKTLTSHNTFNP